MVGVFCSSDAIVTPIFKLNYVMKSGQVLKLSCLTVRITLDTFLGMFA